MEMLMFKERGFRRKRKDDGWEKLKSCGGAYLGPSTQRADAPSAVVPEQRRRRQAGAEGRQLYTPMAQVSVEHEKPCVMLDAQRTTKIAYTWGSGNTST